MATTPVDYAALAQQSGALSSTPPPAQAGGAVDYAALAKQSGAISSTPAAAKQPAAPAPANAASRFGSSFLAALNPFPALKHYLVDVPQQDAQDIQSKLASGDYMGAFGHILKATTPGGSFVPDVVAAQAHQFVQAAKDLNDSKAQPSLPMRLASVGGHAAAGLLPIVGPAAANAGEQIGSGDVAGGLGSAAGLVASVAAPEAIKAVAPKIAPAVDAARDTTADALDSSAQKNIATAINPTTKINKSLVQNQIAPGLADRGTLATSLKDLQSQAQAQIDIHGSAIDDVFDQHADAGTKLSPKPILAALDKAKQEYIVDGEPINAPYVSRLTDMQQQIQRVSDANGGEIPLASLRRIKQIQDETVAQSKGGFALDPDGQSAIAAAKTYGNAIRSTFAESVPELSAPSKEFNFWANVDKVVGDSLTRKTGQKSPLTQKLMQGMGAIVGSHFGPLGTVTGMEAGSKLAQFSNSALWNTLAAGVKSKIADLLETGDEAGARALAKSNGVVPTPAPEASAAAPGVAPSGGVPHANTTTNPGANQEGANVRDANAPGSGAAGGETNPAGKTAFADGGSDPRLGKRTVVKVAGKPGPGYPAQYKLKELDDVNASHNGLTFQPNASYQLTNDRVYENPVNQGKIASAATPAEFDPAQHTSNNQDATSGPPVDDSDNNVLSGNGRTMMQQIVYARNPKGAASLRADLKAKAALYGYDPAEVDRMKQPSLHREIDDAVFPTLEAKQDAVTDFNKTGTAALTPGERALADSRRVSASTLDDVAGRLDAKGSDATIAQVLEGQSGNEVLKNLIGDGVISPQERAAFGDPNGLNKAGRDRIAQLVVGRFFSDPAQMDRIPAGARAKLERMAAPLAQVEAKPGWSLTPEVQSAVDLIDRAKQAGIPSLSDFIQQDGLFGKDKYSAKAVALAKAMQNSKSADVTQAARQYAQDAAYADKGQTLTGDAPTPAESFQQSFGALKSGAVSDAERLTAKAKLLQTQKGKIL